MSDKIPIGYDEIHPTRDSLVITNLINFAEPKGAYGQTDSGMKKVTTTALIFLFYFVLSFIFGLLINGWFGLIFFILFAWLPFRMVSLIVFHEKKVMKELKDRKAFNENFDWSIFIDFYHINDYHPYLSSNIDQSNGVVLRLTRKAQAGSGELRSYEHFEVLSDFYNYCLGNNIYVRSIDTQATNERDKRFDVLREHLGTITNPILQKMMASMYHHLEVESANAELSYEYFILRSFKNENDFLEDIATLTTILSETYKSVRPMNEQEIADLVAASFGLNSFPIKHAMRQVATRFGESTFRLLWVENEEGKRKVISKSKKEQMEEQRKADEQRRKAKEAGNGPKEKPEKKRSGIDFFSANKTISTEEKVKESTEIDFFD